MKYLRVKNWDQFQHYKKRNPPWIKMHRTLIDDYHFAALSDTTKAHLLLIWLLASSYDGTVPDDAQFISSRINAKTKVDLAAIVEAGFLIATDESSAEIAPQPKGNGSQENAGRREAAKRILAFLNEQAKKNFHETDANLKIIEARLKEYTEQQLRGVIVDRVDEWASDEKMSEYLRPATLFNATKCAQYIGQLPA